MTQRLLAALPEFTHEPYFDYRDPAVAARQREAYAGVRREHGGRTLPLLVAGEERGGGETFAVRSPASGEELWRAQNATPAQLEDAVAAANTAFGTWKDSDPLQRALIFLKAARLTRERRMELNAVMSLENGKNWAEADGEIAECVDHFEVFAREALRWADGKAVYPTHGEHVTTVYEPLGVVAVISPWNYPSAIPLGMALGALAAGNTVVWKPAGETPLSSWLLLEILFEAGLPRETVQFLTGDDAVLGDPLVDHKDVRMVAFTGSREIGCRIYERAARVQPGQRWLKRVIAEMGGKGATVVCADADLDAAAQGIVQAAFGYSGQKCSACSRVIAEESVYGELLDRVVALAKELRVGSPEDNADLGPVIHAASARRIREYIAAGKASARLVLGGEVAAVEGAGEHAALYLSPTVFAEVQPGDPLFREEVFGPVLAFTPARDVEHAIALANDSEYGLTAAFYSGDPAKLELARRRIHVGNLYLNRKCTGALSGTHAFGGYGMSGTNAKVGGPDYLFWFVQTKTLAQRH